MSYFANVISYYKFKTIIYNPLIILSSLFLLHSRRQWDGLIKHWKIRIHEWDQSNGASKESNSEVSTTTKRSNDGKIIEDANTAEIEPKDYNSHWLSSKDHRILDWSEECEREEEAEAAAIDNDDDFETKRRKTHITS